MPMLHADGRGAWSVTVCSWSLSCDARHPRATARGQPQGRPGVGCRIQPGLAICRSNVYVNDTENVWKTDTGVVVALASRDWATPEAEQGTATRKTQLKKSKNQSPRRPARHNVRCAAMLSADCGAKLPQLDSFVRQRCCKASYTYSLIFVMRGFTGAGVPIFSGPCDRLS